MKHTVFLPWLVGIALLLLAGPAAAQIAPSPNRTAVNIPNGVDLDEIGADLRRALNAWEQAARSPLPSDWTLLTLAPGETTRVASNVHILVVESSPDGPRILVVGPDGPADATISRHETTTIGPLEVLLTQHIPALRRTEVLVRAAGGESALLADNADAGASPTRINGQPGQYGNPGRLVVDSTDTRAVAFARTWLNERLRGQSREGAAIAARRDVPPRTEGALEVGGGLVGRPLDVGPLVPGYDYRDPVNSRLPANFDDMYHTASVTLHLIRGSSEALRALSSSISYDSAGRTPDNPRVRAGTDSSGATDVRIGQPGDQWRGRLRALEQSGQIHVESTTFLRVPLDGYSASSFRFDNRREGQSGALRARRMGSDAVELMVDTRSGDWSNLGAVSTRVRVRDGATVQLARSATTITRESRSGPPILGDIPFAGPLLGSSSRSDYSSNYALFATVNIE